MDVRSTEENLAGLGHSVLCPYMFVRGLRHGARREGPELLGGVELLELGIVVQ